MESLGKGNAGLAESVMFACLSLDEILGLSVEGTRLKLSHQLTAMGLDRVRTASEVNLSASDIVRQDSSSLWS